MELILIYLTHIWRVYRSSIRSRSIEKYHLVFEHKPILCRSQLHQTSPHAPHVYGVLNICGVRIPVSALDGMALNGLIKAFKQAAGFPDIFWGDNYEISTLLKRQVILSRASINRKTGTEKTANHESQALGMSMTLEINQQQFVQIAECWRLCDNLQL